MPNDNRVRFALVGGFLGAGKTTALCRIAPRLAERGQRVAVITNDQADDLVDSAVAREQGLPVVEIAGGCFCCRFPDLIRACDEILEHARPDIILGEPVGSCLDLAATVLQPLKRYYGERFELSPYSVLVDPQRLEQDVIAQDALGPIQYLALKQLEEADILVLNKVDLLAAERRDELLEYLRGQFPATPVVAMSALSGEGVDAWWDQVAAGGTVGERILDVDYDTYADAEAALGWLNASIALRGEAPFHGEAFVRELLAGLREAIVRESAAVGHIKLALDTPEGQLHANLTDAGATPTVQGRLSGPAASATLTLNARVAMDPAELERLGLHHTRTAANSQRIAVEIERVQSFRPARPTPTHRLGS